MNWRLLTAINALIALVTVCAVIFGVSRAHSGRERSHQNAAPITSAANESTKTADRQRRIEQLDDLSNARVDDLGAVQAAELQQLMSRATPDQLAAMAYKFNDAPTDARTFGGMAVFFQAWTQLDPNGALAGAFRIKDVAMRELAATTVVNGVSPSAAPELIAYLTAHPDKDLADDMQTLLGPLVQSWSTLDPEAAAKFIDDLGEKGGGLSYSARTEIAYNWGTLDPAAALDWVTKNGDKNSENPYLYKEVIRGWCRKDIGSAAAYVSQHLDDSGADEAAGSVVAEMFTSDPKNATAWIDSLPSGAPRASAEYRLASMWSSKDAASAANWFATLPEEEQSNIAATIANNWVDSNWPEASRWLATLTGDARDQAVNAAVNRDGATPVESLSLALWIKSDQMRNEAIDGVIRSWAATDADAAQTWVEGSPLPDEQRDHLRSIISESQQEAAEATERVTH